MTTALISTTNPDHLTDDLIAKLSEAFAADLGAEGKLTRTAWALELEYLATIRTAIAANDRATVRDTLPAFVINRENIRFYGGNPWTSPVARLVLQVRDSLYREARDVGNWAKAAA